MHIKATCAEFDQALRYPTLPRTLLITQALPLLRPRLPTPVRAQVQFQSIALLGITLNRSKVPEIIIT